MSSQTIPVVETPRNLDADFNNPLKISFNPGKLSDLASVSFAAYFLRCKIKHIKENIEEDLDNYSTDCLDPASFSIPRSLREIIDDVIKDTDLSWVEWWSHHKKRVFLRQVSADEMVHWVDDLVWLPDGTINYEKTARKMLHGDKTTNVQKFQLACAYCFMDDVERLTKELMDKAMEIATTKANPRHEEKFYNYWLSRFNPYSANWDLLDQVIHWHVTKRTSSIKYDEWPLIQYSLNHPNLQQRSNKINSIIDLELPRLTLNILSGMPSSEIFSAMKAKGRNIMKALVKNPSYFEQTIMIWKHIILLIENDVLADIIRHVNDIKLERNYANSLMWEMWLATSELQKKFIVDNMIYYFTENTKHNSYCIPNFPLIFDILQRSDPKKRYQYWLDHWPYLVVGQLDHRTEIERIMKLCFANDQDIETFKKTVMIECNPIAEFCKMLILNGRIEEIQTYLEFCISDSQLIRDLKKQIISMVPKTYMLTFLFHWYRYGIIGIFYDHLDDAFGEDNVDDFLEQIVMDDGNLKRLCGMCSSPINLQRVIHFVESFVSVGDNIAKVKLALFEYSYEFEFAQRSVLLDLIAWCFSVDKPLVNKFKTFAARKRRGSDEDDESTDSENRIYKRFREPHRLRNDE